MSSSDENPLSRLDPDAAVGRARGESAESAGPAGSAGAAGSDPPRVPAPTGAVVDTRRYRWAIGIIGLVVVAVVSVLQFATHGVASTGVAAGHRLHWFAAPLAASDLQGDANLRPPCTAAHHDPRALNLCLDARRSAVVLSFYVPGSTVCEHQVDALQALSRRFPAAAVQFLAVAVHAGHAATERTVRAHRWTIPVAYDADGAVGEQYGVAVCPMAELATRGGLVRDRLVGDRWQSAAALGPRVAALVRAGAPAP